MPVEAVVIGASAGALEALSVILPALPGSFRPPVLIVVHVLPDRASVLAELFQRKCQLPVREAEDKEPVRGGTVYFAPPGYHLLVEMDRHLSLSADEPIIFSRPSIDVLFESAADTYGPGVIAVVLSGASHDGARHGSNCRCRPGLAIVQNPGEAFARTMPEAALKACPDARVLSLDEIAGWLLKL